MNIPDNYQTVMPYLILKDAAGFLNFTKQLFNATELQNHLGDDGTIMHGEIKIGDSTIMFAECGGQWQPQPAGLFIYVDNADISYEKAIGMGAKSIMQPSDQSYGRASGIADPYGNTWWITSPLES